MDSCPRNYYRGIWCHFTGTTFSYIQSDAYNNWRITFCIVVVCWSEAEGEARPRSKEKENVCTCPVCKHGVEVMHEEKMSILYLGKK